MENNGKLFHEFEQVDKAAWKSKIEKDLRGANYEEKVVWNTKEGFKVNPFYNHEDLNGLEYLKQISNSGMQENQPETGPRQWLNLPEIPVKDKREANRKALLALNNGADGIVFSLPKNLNRGEFSQLIDGIQLPYCSIGFKGIYSPMALLKHIISYTEKAGFNPETLQGTLNFNFEDISTEDFAESFELLTSLPGFKLILTVNREGLNYQESISKVLTAGVELIEKLREISFEPDQIFKQIQFSWDSGNNYFFEIAALRALKILIVQIARVYGLDSFQYPNVKIHVNTHITVNEETKADPYLNMLSNTNQAMSAIIGGCDSLTVLPHNLGIEQSDDFAERIARNVSNILKEEAYLDKVADPAAGSYYIENLTDQLAEKSWKLFSESV
ncbi:methylmalonyl-CoA mutase family protein [Flexithrix dorotheae]|uniref:methylmalonyl-CoA mutase family protein n=1 Tax=Flexithrix dorotheae TaxID=70993 RepID=UPI00039B3BCF|nr:methylmalonyl-CoA mutase family protein [Flexithrix dorotheae]